MPPFPLARAKDRRYSPRMNTVVVAVYQRHPLHGFPEHPCAQKDRSTSAAARAVDPTFAQRNVIVIQAIGSLTQQAALQRQPRPLRQLLVQSFSKSQQRDVAIAVVMPDV